jgi:hypothetical protein
MKQVGLIKLEGTAGDLTFYKSQGQHLARTKGGVPAERIANDPNFQRTRENNNEFGQAAKFAKAIRLGFTRYSKGSQSVLASLLLAMVREHDTTSARGQRNVAEVPLAGLQKLLGFSFNPQAKYSEVVLGGTLNVATGSATDFALVFGSGLLNPPQGATHYQLNGFVAVIDRANDNRVVRTFLPNVGQGGAIPANLGMGTTQLEFSMNSPVLGTEMLLAGAGIEFLQEVNGTLYPLNDDSKKPFQIVHVLLP